MIAERAVARPDEAHLGRGRRFVIRILAVLALVSLNAPLVMVGRDALGRVRPGAGARAARVR